MWQTPLFMSEDVAIQLLPQFVPLTLLMKTHLGVLCKFHATELSIFPLSVSSTCPEH